MLRDVSFEVEEGGVRLDAALTAKCPSVPRAFAREAIAAGLVTVGGRAVPKGKKLKQGDVVFAKELLEASDNRIAPDPSAALPPVFACDSLLAFDKPAGMKVQPLSCHERGTLMNGVAARWPECAEVGDDPLMAGALHRIDAGTSGLVLVARTDDAFRAVRAQFAARTVEKKYLALVEGRVEGAGRIECDLVHEPGLAFCRMTTPSRLRARNGRDRPMRAVTEFRPLAREKRECEELTLLEVTIFTGVTHQIRAQLAMEGMHIVNDTLYGAFAVEGMAGHRLHALSAALNDPVTGEKLTISTPVPNWARNLMPETRAPQGASRGGLMNKEGK